MGMIRYRQRSYPSGTGAPYRGIETLIKYNGLILNDRRYINNYFVTEVAGLEDADVRDAREDNPEADGENAYNSFYSGRTVSIKGEIQSGNVSSMRDMQRTLKGAYNFLEESDLDFIFNDTDEEFDSTSANLDYYVAQSIVTPPLLNPIWSGISSGKLNVTNVNFNPTKLTTFSDYEGILKFRVGASIPNGAQMSINGRWTSNVAGSFFELSWFQNSGAPILRARNGAATIQSLSATVTPNTDYWLRAGSTGDNYYVNLYTSEPEEDLFNSLPYKSLSGVLTGADATALGQSVKGQISVIYNTGTGATIPAVTGWSLGPFSLRNGDVPDGRLRARKIGKVDMPDSQDSRNPKRPFMITMRASDPRILSRTQPYATADAIASALTFPGDGSGITLPTFFGTPTLVINNRGNYYSYPYVRFYGGLVNPVLYNDNTGEKISIATTIDDGNYIDVDVEKRTIVDSNGNNVYGYLATDHDWMRLASGISNLYLGNESFSGADPRVEIYWRHSWL